MKIDGTSISPVGSVNAANRASQVDKKTRSMGNDQVNVSEKGQLFQQLLQKAKDLPDIREERVRELSEQIEKGEYKVDPEQIAKGILSRKFFGI